ncbi:putative laccase-9 [Triticum dicoccoides]|uniref:putative laccase-9 n=1 Tax=Triticum dicoccoides TaxID=85692 RepID=UPI0018910D76|nr:putative laccase-9 [Triticum dicoccoides]
MPISKKIHLVWSLCVAFTFAVAAAAAPAQGSGSGRVRRHYDFFIREANYTRLCIEKTILTVNGEFPGPTIFARKGDVVLVSVHNQGDQNVTIHWHGVDQPRNPWSDGPAYITQCPIQSGNTFTYRIIFSEEEGTLWWHAHSDFDRATVHGAIVIHPRRGAAYPFPKPHREIPIILGEWWNRDVGQMLAEALGSGGDFQPSDANTINGQPGDLFPCSSDTAFKLPVEHGNTYMLRIIIAALTNEFFFAIAGHRLTVVGTDAAYTKPFTVDHVFIGTGQTKTVLLNADRGRSNHTRYYMVARPYATNPLARFDNSTTTAVLEYIDAPQATAMSDIPVLPAINDSTAAEAYSVQLKSLASEEHPVDVPRHVDEHMLITITVNEIPCTPGELCKGPRNNSLAASLNNISFEMPSTAILGAYYSSVLLGVAKTNFPDNPAVAFNYTSDDLPLDLRFTARDTRVKVLVYGTVVEVVFQDTAILGSESHPMHLHGYSFYVVGRGSGNFDRHKDPATYNLDDPPYQNTVSVPKAGWAAIRFRAANPGVWFMHCHFERHMVWGMETVFIVKNGKAEEAKIMPPPPNMPKC